MRAAFSLFRVASAITVSAAFILGSPAPAAGQTRFSMSVPQGFEDLAAERRTVLDVYFGGRKLGEARAIIQPGFLRFEDPGAVARLIPDVSSPSDLTEALSASLPANVALACQPSQRQDCGRLHPQHAGIILSEDQFRVEIFLNPEMLRKPDVGSPAYLPQPENQPSLISLFGATMSGSSHGDRSYHFQNRSIASIGPLRIRSDSSLASRVGLSFDNLTIEADRADWRYIGGIFWAPGTDLIGRRKILGLGATTQLDTRSDKQTLISTPLTIFLQTSARVEVLINGRLISSGIYSAGQRLVDTTQLPNGSYEVLLRVREDGRPVRDERRFFTKGTQLAPIGRPLFSAFAGLLPESDRDFSLSGRTMFYQASAAFRLSPALGIDGVLLGTQDKAIIEGGLILHTRLAQLRLSGLASTSADVGAVFRATSVSRGPLAVSFDLRKIRSRDGGPLLPISASNGSFSEDPKSSLGDRGSYTQALALVSYRLGNALLRFSGTYRHNASEKATYNIGAALDIPVVRTSNWELLLQSDIRKTERDLGSFFGVRFQATNGNMAFSGSTGLSQSKGNGRSRKMVGEAQVAWYRQGEDQTQLSADAAYGQDANGAHARASGMIRSSLANGRADLLHNFGKHGSTQVAANINVGLAMRKKHVLLGGRQMNDSAVIIAVSGGETGQAFELLVDEVVRGVIANNESLSLFLQPYRTYGVRLRPHGAMASSFDTTTREVTLYPGNVARIDWSTTPVVVLFGRAVDIRGRPLSDADISGPHGIGRTDRDGYFQVETSTSDLLRVVDRGGASCSMTFPDTKPVKGYVSAGEVVCR